MPDLRQEHAGLASDQSPFKIKNACLPPVNGNDDPLEKIPWRFSRKELGDVGSCQYGQAAKTVLAVLDALSGR